MASFCRPFTEKIGPRFEMVSRAVSHVHKSGGYIGGDFVDAVIVVAELLPSPCNAGRALSMFPFLPLNVSFEFCQR